MKGKKASVVRFETAQEGTNTRTNTRKGAVRIVNLHSSFERFNENGFDNLNAMAHDYGSHLLMSATGANGTSARWDIIH